MNDFIKKQHYFIFTNKIVLFVFLIKKLTCYTTKMLDCCKLCSAKW